MSRVRVLVGTKKGAFILTADGKRERWEISGPHFGGWEIYHVKGSPAQPDRLYASQTSGWFGQVIQRSDDGGKTWDRAAGLMQRYASGTVLQGLVDAYAAPPALQIIDLNMSQVRRVLGVDLPIDEAMRILKALEFRVELTGPTSLRVTTPPHRLDIQSGAADLIEELARIHGYDRLPATLIADHLPEQHTNRALVLEERVRDILVGTGLQEVITYSLTEPSREAALVPPSSDYVRLVNPVTSERVVMRHSVLASVIEIAANNLRHTEDVRVFEIGRVYLPRPGQKLPDEPRRLALFLAGRRQPEFWRDAGNKPAALDFFDLKGVVEALMFDLHVGGIEYRPSQAPYLHPGRAAELVVGGNPIGDLGEMHPKTAEAYGLGARTALVAEVDLEALLAAVPERHQFEPVPRFPAALRDIAVIVPEDTTGERVESELRAAGGNLLRGVRLFDLYHGDSIPPGTKSLAYALSYQADDRTLTDKEVDKAHKKIEDRLKHELKAQIRGQE